MTSSVQNFFSVTMRCFKEAGCDNQWCARVVEGLLLDCENTAATFSQTAAFKGLAFDVEMCYGLYIGSQNWVPQYSDCIWFVLLVWIGLSATIIAVAQLIWTVDDGDLASPCTLDQACGEWMSTMIRSWNMGQTLTSDQWNQGQTLVETPTDPMLRANVTGID